MRESDRTLSQGEISTKRRHCSHSNPDSQFASPEQWEGNKDYQEWESWNLGIYIQPERDASYTVGCVWWGTPWHACHESIPFYWQCSEFWPFIFKNIPRQTLYDWRIGQRKKKIYAVNIHIEMDQKKIDIFIEKLTMSMTVLTTNCWIYYREISHNLFVYRVMTQHLCRMQGM